VLLLLISSFSFAQPAVRTVGCLAPADGATCSYVPQAGDIIFFDDFNKVHHLAYKLSGTGGPTHVGMVVARSDGTLALFDITGPTIAFARVALTEIDSRLHQFDGLILVRRLKQPLTDEQSRDLTNFAYSQLGKRFALVRVVMQGTPFNARTGLRHTLFGRTYMDRHRWFCSEIVVSGCASAGLLDGNAIAGNAVFPRDLAFDETLDLSQVYHPAAQWVK
jgi:hypothetical protein